MTKATRALWCVAMLAIAIGCSESSSEGTGGTGGEGGTSGTGGAGIVASEVLIYLADGVMADMGGRAGADAIAQSLLPAVLPGLSSGAVYKAHAFVSITDDALADFPVNHGLPGALPVFGIDDGGIKTALATDWADLMDGEIMTTMGAALGVQDFNYFWSGSNPQGQATGDDCEGFTVLTGDTGGVSNRMNTTVDWLWDPAGPFACGAGYYLLGVAYCTANCPE